MKRTTVILLLALAAAPRGRSQEAPPSLLTVSPAPRASGLGEAFAPVSDDIGALYFNPAGLSILVRGNLSVMHLRLTEEVYGEAAAFVMPVNERCGWGFQVGTIDYGTVGSSPSGNALHARDVVAGAAFGFRPAKDFSLGFQTRWTSQSLGPQTRHGLWWDLGFLVRPTPRLQLGAALRTMGVADEGGGPPFTAQWGASYRGWSIEDDKESLLLCAGSTHDNGGHSFANAGIEFNHQDRFCFRIGYSPELSRHDLGATQGINLGTAARFRSFQADYAITLGESAGEVHRVSLTYLFPRLAPRPVPHLTGVDPKPTLPNSHTVPLPTSTPTASVAPAPPVLQPASTPEVEGDPKNLVVMPFKLDDTTLMTGEACMEKGQALERQGLWRDALRYYLVAIEKNPKSERAWLLLGNLQTRMGKESYKEALRLNPGNEALRQWLSNHP